MANTLKNKKTPPPPEPVATPPKAATPKAANTKAVDPIVLSADRKRQIRLGSGIFLMLTGIFTCVSIISYFFSWKADQIQVFKQGGALNFLFLDQTAVTNWGGRLGAALSHVLVYKGAGIASLAVGISVASVGLNMIYGKQILSLLRYMRWLSITLLLVAPILTYLIPHSEFPIGGALGKNVIEYFNGLLGFWGTGMALISIVLFFVFVIFALDISPLIKRMQLQAKKVADSMKTTPAFNEQGDQLEPEAGTALEMEEQTANSPNEEHEHTPFIIGEQKRPKEWDMEISEKEQEFAEDPIVPETEVDESEDPSDEEEHAAYQQYLAEKNAAEAAAAAVVPEPEAPADLFITKQVEEPVIKHGDHISIADNEPFAPEETLRSYKYPTLDMMEERVQETISLNKEELERNKDQIIQTLRSFGIEIKTITATIGPTVTLYEIVPAEGVRISKIRNLEDDIALALAALGIRIIAPIPGKGTIGIEVPNANKQIVGMKALLSSEKFVNSKMSLPIALGKKIDNENYIVDLATMPHLLMAGATGQGKSVGINAILVSLLYKKHPSQLKFVMVDPKKVELSIYRTIEKHFLAKLPNEEESIITDIKKVIYTLKALCDEMDDRYGLLKDAGARNIREYNEKFIARRLNPENGHKFLPFIVLVIDEFADLIMTAGKEVEMPIARLAQLARAVGIHLIIATQRPSVNVITGTIKANFPARIAFKVSAKVDSRTILDTGGAEQLVGRGDMLISHGSELFRLQCAFVDTPEVENVVNFIGRQQGYPHAHPLPEPEMDDDDAPKVDLKNRDKLFEDCARLVVQMQSGSTSNLQRRLNLGYNRAGRIMDQLEAAGIVGPAVGSKPREVYFKTESELEQFLQSMS